MHKFKVGELPTIDNKLPVCYKVYFGSSKYYIHKGADLKKSLNLLLEDVFRGIRGYKTRPEYEKIVAYCNKYPAITNINVLVVANSQHNEVLDVEKQQRLWSEQDMNCLNNFEVPQYIPEIWVRAESQQRCLKCVKVVFYDGESLKCKFCPNCGRIN